MAYTTEPLSPRPKYDIAELLVAGVTGLMLALAALFLCVMPFAANLSGGRDFVVFWATGQQLVHHANPYDGDAIVKIERSAGLSFPEGAMFMRNPPWGLPLAYPLGLIGMRAGALLWSLALLASLIVSVRLLWRLHGRPRSYLHWLGISFAPALICLVMGQTSLFALLGYVLFLDLHQEHPFPGWSFSLALRAETSAISDLRRSAAGVDTVFKELQDTGGNGGSHGRQLHGRVFHRPGGVDRLRADAARDGSRDGARSLPERRAAPLAQSADDRSNMASGHPGLRLGADLFLVSPARMGLDKAR